MLTKDALITPINRANHWSTETSIRTKLERAATQSVSLGTLISMDVSGVLKRAAHPVPGPQQNRPHTMLLSTSFTISHFYLRSHMIERFKTYSAWSQPLPSSVLFTPVLRSPGHKTEQWPKSSCTSSGLSDKVEPMASATDHVHVLSGLVWFFLYFCDSCKSQLEWVDNYNYQPITACYCFPANVFMNL